MKHCVLRFYVGIRFLKRVSLTLEELPEYPQNHCP